ncbi:MAG: hypothetical protein ACRCTZ_20135 [Sarcina sp.]
MKKHIKTIIVILIIAIAGIAVLVHKKLEKKDSGKSNITVTIENEVNNTNLLNNFKMTTTAKNVAEFLQNNYQLFNPQFKTENGDTILTSLEGSADSSTASWDFSYSDPSQNIKPGSNIPLNKVKLSNDANLTLIYKK